LKNNIKSNVDKQCQYLLVPNTCHTLLPLLGSCHLCTPMWFMYPTPTIPPMA
jgi:hypothetical protein